MLQKLGRELRAVGLAMLYFGCWLAVLLIIKQLVLVEYQIEFYGLSNAVVAALILSKETELLETYEPLHPVQDPADDALPVDGRK